MSDKALVPAPPPEMRVVRRAKLPKPRMARSLAEAGPTDMIAVNRRGQVVSPALLGTVDKIWVPYMAVLWALVLWTLAPGLYSAVMVPAAGWITWQFVARGRYSRGLLLLNHRRYDEAEAVLRPLVAAPLMQRKLRGVGWHLLAEVARGRGELAEALGRTRKALMWLKVERPRALPTSMLEIQLLSDLDKLDEAERLLALRHPSVPTGDYHRMKYWTTELYLALGRGRHALGAAELDARVKAVLPLRTSRALLALLAWAHQAAGDAARGRELLRTALEREERFDIALAMPRLQEWIEASRDPLAALPP